MSHKGGKVGVAHSKARREERRKVVAKLAEARSARSPKEQLALLDKRLGKGEGAKKERARLLEAMTAKPKSDATATVPKKGKGLSDEEKAAKTAARNASLAEHEDRKKTKAEG